MEVYVVLVYVVCVESCRVLHVDCSNIFVDIM